MDSSPQQEADSQRSPQLVAQHTGSHSRQSNNHLCISVDSRWLARHGPSQQQQKHNPPSKILECEDDNERATLALQRTVVRHKHPCVNAKDTTST
jgi:hypothetical protein